MKRVQDKTIVFGHRGYPAKYAENSLEGFSKTVEGGAEGIEFDVQLTKDQVPVVMHDEQVDRTTDGTGYIKDFTLKELRCLHLANGEPVPKLAEVLQLLENQDLEINLEFKTSIVHYQGIEAIVLNLVDQYSLVNPVIYSSFDYVTLKNCQEIDSSRAYCYLTDEEVSNSAKLLRENNFAGVHPQKLLKSPEAITQRIWTVDDLQTAKTYFQQGIAGIFTNDFPTMTKLRDQVQN